MITIFLLLSLLLMLLRVLLFSGLGSVGVASKAWGEVHRLTWLSPSHGRPRGSTGLGGGGGGVSFKGYYRGSCKGSLKKSSKGSKGSGLRV